MTDVDLTISGQRTGGPGSARLIATLTIAGMISGLAIAGAYQLTKPTIEANEQRFRRAAVLRVLPGATSMQALVLDDDGRLVIVDGDAAGGRETIYAGYGPDGHFLGYAIEGAGPGYQDTIRLLYGYDPAQRRTTGMDVLESRETPGLGDRIYKDDAFVASFRALSLEPGLAAVTDGRDADHEVDAITGATISSRAVVEIINKADRRWRAALTSPPPVRATGAGREDG